MNYSRLLPQNLSSAYQNSKNLERMANAEEKKTEEISHIRSELQKTREEFADYKTKQDEQRTSDLMQAQIDKKQQRRHEYLVSAFTVALTLFIEHFFDIIKLMKILFEKLVTLLK